MTKYNDFPQPNKPTGGGFRRFLILVALVVTIGFIIAAWSGRAVVTNKPPAVADVVTTATPAAGVAVNVNQSQAAPNVNIAIEQAAPAPVPTADYAIQLAFMEAQRAFSRADEAYRASERAYTHADVLHPRVDLIETRIAAPPTPSTELQLLQFESQRTNATITILTAAFFFTIAAIIALALWVTWRTNPPTPPAPTPPAPPPPPVPSLDLHGANTVLHGAGTVQSTEPSTTSGNALQLVSIDERRATIPRRLEEITPGQRRYIQNTYNRLKTYSGTSRHIWNYHNQTTLNIVKSVVDAQSQQNNRLQ